MATPTVVSIADCEISAASPALSVTITCDNANYAVRTAAVSINDSYSMLSALATPVMCGVGTNTISIPISTAWQTAIGSKFPTTTSATAEWYLDIIDVTTQQQVALTTGVSNTVSVTSAASPTISAVTLSEGNSTIAAITDGAGFIKDKSDLQIAVTAARKCGASLTGYAASIGAQSISSSTASFDFGTIAVTGDTVTVTVTDSRGFTATSTTPIEIVTYTAPQITSATAQRKYMTPHAAVYEVAGQIDPVVLGGVKRNAVQSLQLRYKVTGAQSWYTDTLTATEATDGTFTCEGDRGFVADTSYVVQFVVTDAFSETAYSAEITLPVTLPDIFCGNSKVGIRTYTPQTELDVNGVTSQNGFPIMGYVSSLTAIDSANLDLNDVRTDGIYKLFPAAAPIATLARHYPVEAAGILEVFTAPLGENILQRYTPWNCSGIYLRVSYNSGSTWSTWVFARTESIPT